MTELKIGGNNVGKIMYNGQEFGGATKLEPGTILYVSSRGKYYLEDVHLLSTTKNWSNIDGIDVTVAFNLYDINDSIYEVNISGDDFKSLDTGKKYDISKYSSLTASRSIIDGEYRLNISGYYNSNDNGVIVIKAI